MAEPALTMNIYLYITYLIKSRISCIVLDFTAHDETTVASPAKGRPRKYKKIIL